MVLASSAHTTLDVYRQRKPQDSAYYRCVEDCFETLEQVYQDRFEQKYGFFRPYVRQVIYRYPWPKTPKPQNPKTPKPQNPFLLN